MRKKLSKNGEIMTEKIKNGGKNVCMICEFSPSCQPTPLLTNVFTYKKALIGFSVS